VLALNFQLRLDGIVPGGLTMRNSKVALLGYGLAIGFILAVAFHSPAKLLVAVDEPAPAVTSNAK
jgi:hypothetical protein